MVGPGRETLLPSRPSGVGATPGEWNATARGCSSRAGPRARSSRGGLNRRNSTVRRNAPHQLEPASVHLVLDREEGLIGSDPRVGYFIGADLTQIELN